MKITYGFVLLPERRKLLTSQEEDHIKVLTGEMEETEYYKKWELSPQA